MQQPYRNLRICSVCIALQNLSLSSLRIKRTVLKGNKHIIDIDHHSDNINIGIALQRLRDSYVSCNFLALNLIVNAVVDIL